MQPDSRDQWWDIYEDGTMLAVFEVEPSLQAYEDGWWEAYDILEMKDDGETTSIVVPCWAAVTSTILLSNKNRRKCEYLDNG
jgi:hypothetical protein